MSLGQSFVGKVGAAVNWIKATAIIRLDYNSKNRAFTDAFSITGTFVKTIIKAFTDTLSISESVDLYLQKNLTDSASLSDSKTLHASINIVESVTATDQVIAYYTGLINGNMMNVHQVNHEEDPIYVANIIITIA